MPDFNKFKQALNSNTKSNEGALDENGQLKERHVINGVPNVVSKTFEQSYTTSPETLESLGSKGIQYNINKTDIEDLEETENIHKALQQGALSKIGNSLEQLVVGEVLLGSLKGFTDIYDAFVGHFFDKGGNDYTSAASGFLENLQEKNREAFAIYRENPYKAFDISDVGWWADNFVSVGSTLSLLIPSKGIITGLSKLGKLAKAESWATKGISKLAKTNKGVSAIEQGNGIGRILTHSNYYGKKVNEFADLAGTALMSRIAENYQEARGIYKSGYDKITNTLKKMSEEDKEEFFRRNPQFVGKSNDDIAEQLASDAANDTFWADMPLILMDFIQYKGVESALKGGAKQITSASLERAQRKALARLAGNKALEESIDAQTKGFFKKIGSGISDFSKDVIKHPTRAMGALQLSEGLEEGWQGIVEAYNTDDIDTIIDLRHNDRNLGSYITDGHIWEQAFWGALGGIVFQGAAKGLGKLKRTYDAKQLLKKGDITKEQYSEFVRSNAKIREEEINNRQTKLDKLIEDLNLIEAGQNPYATKDEERRLDTPEAKETIKNEVLNNWVTDFTMDAVDTGNMELLSEFIKSPEFNKYMETAGANIDILNKKSLASRVDDVYELYLKNTDAVIENTSANDYDSIRKAARWLTRNELDIASGEDQIAEMRKTLSQLTDYVPGTDLERFRKFDILYNQLQRFNETKKELNDSYKKHTISKSALDVELERTNKILDLITLQIVALNLSPEIIQFLEDENYIGIESTVKDLKNNSNFAKEFAETTKQIKSGIDNIIQAEIEQQIRIYNHPTTQQEFEDLYNSINLDSVRYFNARVNKAINRVKDYLINSNDLDAAIASAMEQTFNDVSNPIRKRQLQEAMDILKIGSHSRPELTEMFNEEVAQIKQEREANKAKENTVVERGKEVKSDFVPTNPEPAKKQNDNDSSKGGEQQSTTTATTEIKDNGKTPVEKYDGPEKIDEAPELDALAAQEKKAFDKENEGDDTGAKANLAGDIFIFSNPDEETTKREIISVFVNLGRTHPELVEKVVKDGAGSDTYNKFIKLAVDRLTSSGIYARFEVERLADYQLKIYLHRLIAENKVPKSQKEGIFKLINDIDSILSKQQIDEKFSAVTDISDEQFNANMEKFLKDYFGLGDKVAFETRNGVKIINLDSLFEDLVKLSEEGVYNFEELAEIVNNIFNYANSYKGTEFKFISEDLFDIVGTYEDILERSAFDKSNTTQAKINNLSVFINKLYTKQTMPDTVVDDNMHFNISSTIRQKDLTYLKNKQLKIKYKEVGGVNTISLYYTDDKGEHEVGFLTPVEQGDKDNKTLRLSKQNGLITSVTKENGEYHITNRRVEELLYDIINAINSPNQEGEYKQLANMLYSLFAFRQTGEAIWQQNNIADDLFKNSVFRELLDLTNLHLPIGQEYTRENGSKGRANVKITSENLNSISDKETNAIKLLNAINNILFFDYNLKDSIEVSSDLLRDGLQRYIEKLYKNYSETLNYQHALDNNVAEDIKLEFVAADNSYLNYDTNVKRDVSTLGIKTSIRNHPFIYLNADGVMRAEGIDKSFPNRANFKAGTSGILLDVRNGNPMIAFLTDAKKVKTQKQLYTAINKEYNRLLNEYFSSSGTRVLDTYNDLLDFFNNLFGNSYSLFDGLEIRQTEGGFYISKKDKDNKVIPIITFYKYAATYDKASSSFIVDGQKIPNSELSKHYRPTINVYSGKDIYRISNVRNEDNKKMLSEAFSNIFDNVYFSRNAITIDPKRSNKFVQKTGDTDFTLKIGDYKQKYKNYADYIVKNNAFTTTHVGSRNTNTMKVNASTAQAIFIKYTGQREYISQDEKVAQQGFAANLKQQDVKEGDTLSSDEVLTYAGYTQEDIDKFNKVFDLFGKKDVTISFEKKIVNGEEVFAGYKDGKIVLYNRAIFAISSDKRHASRLLIHENIHDVIEEKGFFTSHKYGNYRTTAIIDTWNQFYEQSKDNPQLTPFIEDFLSKYGNLRTSDKFEDRALFANEWVAEVMSSPALMDYLNSLEYEGTIKLERQGKNRSILQKILDVLVELFGSLGKINKDSLLEQFYNAVGNSTIIETIDDIDNGGQQEETIEQSNIPIDEQSNIPLEGTQEGVGELDEATLAKQREAASWFDFADEIDDSSNDGSLFSAVDALPQEIRMDSYLRDTSNNPYDMELAPDMDSWLQSKPAHERAAIAANLANGAFEYICR